MSNLFENIPNFVADVFQTLHSSRSEFGDYFFGHLFENLCSSKTLEAPGLDIPSFDVSFPSSAVDHFSLDEFETNTKCVNV